MFRQVCNLIPGHMIPVLARPHTIDARGFSATSHVQALIYGHTSHALSLNDICDALSVHASEFMRVRGATPPARNTISNANRTRDPAMAEALYWQMLAHLQTVCPGFTEYGKHAGFIFRLKREIFAMDSTTLQLTLASIDWARHRRREAAATCHMRLNIGTFLPTYVVVEDAAHHDSVRADVLCAGIVRTALWVKTDLGELLACYGTANGPHRPVLCAKEPFLPGVEAFSSSLMGQHG